ncbi:hypothetical protein PG995_005698 [Apiospora arundinis]
MGTHIGLDPTDNMPADVAITDFAWETQFMHPVVVVCESPNKQVAKDTITLHVETSSSPSPSVLFSFCASTADRALSLQLTPDRISSLTRTTHDHTQVINSPPCMDLVRQQLGTKRNLTRLQFRLRCHGQLINSIEGASSRFQDLGASDDIMSLAATLTFSVYMPHDALSKAKYNIFYRAVRPFLGSEEATERPEILPPAQEDACRNHIQGNHTSPPPEYVNEDERRTPRPAESDNDTVAVTTPSGYGPPGDDDELPGYPDDESEGFAPGSKENIRKRHFSRGSSEGSSCLRGTSKRGRLWSPDAEAFIETDSPSPPIDVNQSGYRLNVIEAWMRLHDQRTEALEAENKLHKDRNAELEHRVAELESRNMELEHRVVDLESRVDQLENQHEVMEETIANVDVRSGELDADCSRIGLELAEIRDMSRDAIIDEINDKVQESMGDMVAMYREELKQKLITALQAD